jgi:hypothetical protein
MPSLRNLWLGVILGILASCATGEDLDEQGTPGAAGNGNAAGSTANGGSSGDASGGAPSGGSAGQAQGGAPSGGETGAGGSAMGGAGGDCPVDQKKCGGVCIAPSPANGCAAADCNPCTLVANSTPTCTNGLCDFTCDPGFSRQGSACVGTGGGGAPGAGGSSGGGTCVAPCDPSKGEHQFVCGFACVAFANTIGLCWPAPVSCCLCIKP